MTKNWNGLPLVVLGSGGISKETFHLIEKINNNNRTPVFDFLGFVEEKKIAVGKSVIGKYKVVTSDIELSEYAKKFAVLGAVIPFGLPELKEKIYNQIANIPNIVFPNIVHPDVSFHSNSVLFGIGNIITSNVSMTCSIKIGNFNLSILDLLFNYKEKVKEYILANGKIVVQS